MNPLIRSRRLLNRVLPVVAFGVGLTSGLLIAHLTLLDGVGGLFAIGSSLTEYAPGYSDQAFRRVQLGDSERAVLELLGPPLVKFEYPTGATVTWGYTRSRIHRSYRYRRRQVVFGRDGKEVKRFTMDDPNNQFTYDEVEKAVVALLDGKQ